MRPVLAPSLLAACSLLLAAPARADTQVVVERGMTLYKIAKRHGCTVEALQRANDLDGTTIFPGQELSVPACKAERDGDRDRDREPARGGGGKARRGKDKRAARMPDPADYDLVPAGRAVKARKGQSIGTPWDGRLQNPDKLPKGRGWFIRRPERVYGASHVITHVQRAIKAVRKRFPRVHALAIGDISDKDGGEISLHRSHESGRDIDVGLYFKKRPEGYPENFVGYQNGKLDFAATWALVHAFARTSGAPNGVQAIYLDFDLQGLLYKWAEDRGVPKPHLDKLFEYPDAGGSGIVRHEPGHDDHLHVRFKCPDKDTRCEG